MGHGQAIQPDSWPLSPVLVSQSAGKQPASAREWRGETTSGAFIRNPRGWFAGHHRTEEEHGKYLSKAIASRVVTKIHHTQRNKSTPHERASVTLFPLRQHRRPLD